MKNLLYLLLVALFALAGCGERHIPAPRVAANDFFQAISESRFQAAYDSTAFAFQAKTNFNSFRATARDMKLPESISCQWNSEEKKDGEAKLTGEIVLPEGKKLSVNVKLVQERGVWRIFDLRTASTGGKEEDRFSSVGKTPELTRPSSIDPPTEAAARKLAQDSVLLFNDAIQRKNFTDFFAQVSSVWQQQLTVGQLKRSFQPFIDAGVNLEEVANLDAVFDVVPQVDSQGILHLKGHFDVKDQRASFALRFIFEFPYWKLFGLSVEISEPGKANDAENTATAAETQKPAEGATPVPASSGAK